MPKKKKKKILYSSNFCRLATGFGRHAKEVLTHLASTGKYDLIEYAHAPVVWNDENTRNQPWPCYGAVPDDPSVRDMASKDPAQDRAMRYGSYYIDSIIAKEKPDVFIGAEDFWAFYGYTERPWWNKFPCVIWTTLDSLPLFKPAVDNADKIENYWVWADFARDEMHRLGHKHVKTVPALIDNGCFKPMADEDVAAAKKSSGLEGYTVFGFVFRNQLRKLVGSLVEGFSLFKKENPDAKAKLLLHTCWSEGWNILDFIKEFDVDPSDVYTSYVCRNCGIFRAMPFQGEGLDCPICNGKECSHTPSIDYGVKNEELNILYNVMDAYIHPVTSGGFEMPLLEAALVGKPLATAPYACCEDYTKCEDVFSLDYKKYRELGTQFIKSQPEPDSIKEFMVKIHGMEPAERKAIGSRTREWALEKYDTKRHLKFLEDFIDGLPENNYSYEFSSNSKDENYPLKNIPGDSDFIKDIYKGCWGLEEQDNSPGVAQWLEKIKDGTPREEIHAFFVGEAEKFNKRNKKLELRTEFSLPDGDDRKKLAYIMPQSYGDCFLSSSILSSMTEAYPPDEWAYFVVTKQEYNEMFEHIPHIHKLIPYTSEMPDNFQWWEGVGQERGLVDVALQPYILTQRNSCYNHNGEDVDELQNLKCLTC